MKINYRNPLLSVIFMLVLCNSVFSQKNNSFTIILDAGHGGKDPGNTYHGYKEKEIALKTTLKVGKYLEQDKDFKIIYTRTTDVFVDLEKRPKIANKANAKLFVSIHCNSVKNFGPSGTETFVMGLSRSNMNIEVAKNENSVILLEKNYKEKYLGFDPKKPESLIGLKMMQEENLNSSINLATKIQSNFTKNLNRHSRGVKQQPLWVLDAAYMPSVLIELGFLSNQEEGAFLNSDTGQEKMAKGIAEAIIKYKNEYFGDSKKASVVLKSESSSSQNLKNDNSIDSVYKVQIAVSPRKLSLVSSNFKGLKNISSMKGGSLYKYMYGETTDLLEAKKMEKEAKNKGYSDAFIIEFKDGKSARVR
ncbi:N-acetylmuramoyl-L-alanine amidase family protein [Flavobacterium flavipallidum]|uniref:N-acetylmuramoyl-L-alanine amidase n=1 Tax=Flavobacterium flavipallidum TaxID=3139140 RepID=A0ABU9HM52_9FLAO